jgi:hypothetical protein
MMKDESRFLGKRNEGKGREGKAWKACSQSGEAGAIESMNNKLSRLFPPQHLVMISLPASTGHVYTDSRDARYLEKGNLCPS